MHDRRNPDIRAYSSRLLFAREFLRHPALLGSLLPSSRFLVRRLLRQVDWTRTRTLVEYGPGVGTFTDVILKRIRSDTRVVAIEASAAFVRHLRLAYPDPRLTVVHGSAANVCDILRHLGLGHVDVIISGIPFSNIPREDRRQILLATKRALRPGGRFLIYQFTSAVRPDLERVFGDIEHQIEAFNILPARIFTAMNHTPPTTADLS